MNESLYSDCSWASRVAAEHYRASQKPTLQRAGNYDTKVVRTGREDVTDPDDVVVIVCKRKDIPVNWSIEEYT